MNHRISQLAVFTVFFAITSASSSPTFAGPAPINPIAESEYKVLSCKSTPTPPDRWVYETNIYNTPSGEKAHVVFYHLDKPASLIQETVAVTSRTLTTSGDEMIRGSKLSLKLMRHAPLSPQRYKTALNFTPANHAPVTSTFICQSIDRLPPKAVPSKVVFCRPSQEDNLRGIALNIQTAAGKYVLQYGDSYDSRTSGSFERSTAVSFKETGDAQNFEGDSVNLSIDLSTPHMSPYSSEYNGTGTIIVEKSHYPAPSTYESENLDLLCSLPNYIPPTARAIHGFMTGRGPAVDPRGLENLSAMLKALSKDKVINIVSKAPGGDEGGTVFCIELTDSQPNAKLGVIFNKLKTVQFNHQSTSFNLNPLTSCPRQ